MAGTQLQQPPYDTSLMGVAKGALEHFGVACTKAEAFVLAGHAFVINIHEALCPSGPYCWEQAPCHRLLGNLGLAMTPLGMAAASAPAAEKAALEAAAREAMAGGAL